MRVRAAFRLDRRSAEARIVDLVQEIAEAMWD